MAYCTIDDIKKLLPEDVIIQLTDDENLKPEAINPADEKHANILARIEEAIATADAEIDSYCSVRYSVPLSPVPGVVAKLSVTISIYYLYTRRSVPERIETSYDKAVARLKDISRGLMALGIDPPPPAPTTDRAESNKPVRDRIFTIGKMRGF